jgi:phage head maturation protease
MSFGFTVSSQTVEEDKENKEYIRRITAFDTIYDVSVVDFPAYDDTSIEARSDQAEFFKELEKKEMAERRRKLMLMTMC